MPSLLLVVFALQLVIHLINTVGASAITTIAWFLYSKLPTSTSHQASRSRQLRNEILRLKREMNGTSAQDEFSKWARLRRQHDKVLAEHDKTSKDLKSFKSQFDSTINALRWLCTNGLRLVLQFWFQTQPMFWLPRGWVPYYAEWLLSFPRAPVGAVSIQVWAGACAAVISLVSVAAAAGWALVLERTSRTKAKNGPIKMTAQRSTDETKEL